MKQNLISRIAISSCIVLLSGCGRIIDWGTNCFVQGEKIERADIPHVYVRSIAVYDQFATIARFDALWLADDVKIAYANVYSMKFGKNEDRHNAFLRRQLEENRHFISFYVLTPEKVSLGQPRSKWGLFLLIGGNTYQPIQLKKVELDPIYEKFFKNKYSGFKSAYHVKFDACDSNDVPLLHPGVEGFGLIFRSVDYETRLDWAVSQQDQQKECPIFKGNQHKELGIN